MRLRQLFEDKGKTVAVGFGRLNPPTLGHEKLVAAILKQKADDHFLFVSHQHKGTGKNEIRLKNPLPFSYKIELIKKAFSNISIGDTSITTVMDMMKYLENQGYEKLIFVAGSDRVDSFNQLLNKQNGIDYNFKSITVVSSGNRDPDSEGVEGASGTKVRDDVINNDFESFKGKLATGIQSGAKEIFAALRQGLEPWLVVETKKGNNMRISELIENQDLEEMAYDTMKHPKYGKIEWRNHGGAHVISTTNPDGSMKIFTMGPREEIAKKWSNLKDKLSKALKADPGVLAKANG